jgi:uncharacterized protein YqjF (DUF2071 family)
MKVRTMSGVIERRLLLNYRVDPAVIGPMLPHPFRPLLVNGYAVAGTCLLRLRELRPRLLPGVVGVRLEGAAHRIAVEWDGPDGTATAVYIRRRETSSVAAVLGGGRIFPGAHHYAAFNVHETAATCDVAFTADKGRAGVSVSVRTRMPEQFRPTPLFSTLLQASQFFRERSDAFSATRRSTRLDGLHMTTEAWPFEPTELVAAQSSFFDDPMRFPVGSATLDSAFLMREVPVALHALASMAVQPRDVTLERVG